MLSKKKTRRRRVLPGKKKGGEARVLVQYMNWLGIALRIVATSIERRNEAEVSCCPERQPTFSDTENGRGQTTGIQEQLMGEIGWDWDKVWGFKRDPLDAGEGKAVAAKHAPTAF